MEENKGFSYNVDTSAIDEQIRQAREESEARAQAKADKKNGQKNNNKQTYNLLEAFVPMGQQRKVMTIRLLPFKGDKCVAKEIFLHSINRFNKSLYVDVTNPANSRKSDWLKFMCPKHMGTEDKCPFCEMEEKASALAKTETDENKKKSYKDTAFLYKLKTYYLFRCIERGKEHEGVKYWRTVKRYDGNGVWDKIMDIYNARAEQMGVNIFDVNSGFDITVTITRDANGQTSYSVVDVPMAKPITDNKELGESWLNDCPDVKDIFSIYSYNKLDIICRMGIPVWDEVEKKYVDKEAKQKLDAERNEAEKRQNLVTPTNNFDGFTAPQARPTNFEQKGPQGTPYNESDALPF